MDTTVEAIPILDRNSLLCLPHVVLTRVVDLPDEPGIYFALSGFNELLYIGRSNSLKGRWVSHHRMQQLSRFHNVRIAYQSFQSYPHEDLEAAEAHYISTFSPPLNNSQLQEPSASRFSPRWPAPCHQCQFLGRVVTMSVDTDLFVCSSHGQQELVFQYGKEHVCQAGPLQIDMLPSGHEVLLKITTTYGELAKE